MATAAGLVRRRRDGRFRGAARQRADASRLTEEDLGGPLGPRATLVQFSSAFCAPCRVARQLLANAAAAQGVSHVEIDVAARFDLVQRLAITRTPTVVVLGPDGQVIQRATGVPGPADIEAAIAVAAGSR